MIDIQKCKICKKNKWGWFSENPYIKPSEEAIKHLTKHNQAKPERFGNTADGFRRFKCAKRGCSLWAAIMSNRKMYCFNHAYNKNGELNEN